MRSAASSTPRLSVIVPLFNCLSLTQAMLASLRATLPPGLEHEIILIDDGSTDGTREWLDTLADPPFRVMRNERNLGFAATNNRAIATARGELLVLLNNDLVLRPGWLAPMIVAHRSLGRRAGLIGNIQLDARSGVVDHAGIEFSLKAKPEHVRRRVRSLRRRLAPVRQVPAITAACLLVSSSLWRELGGFDEGYMNGGEDVDLCFRARAAGRINAVALQSVVIHHVSSSIGRKQRDEANSARLAEKWRHEFVRCAARAWCREYHEAILIEPRDHEPTRAWRLWSYAAGLSHVPPAEAIEALEAAVDLEFVRWNDLLSRPASAPRDAVPRAKS